MTRRAAIIVLDGLGIGPAPDTAAYGDQGSDTLGNVLRDARLDLPHLTALGLGRCAPLNNIPPVPAPTAAWGTAEPASSGKDSTTGHWEICGVILERPFPTYPKGFPRAVIEEFSRRTGRGVLGNKAASGTTILAELGAEHVRSGSWIVYTSADSVFQVAAHEEVVPLDELYAACRSAREMLRGEHGVSRVIARPFTGGEGAWTRTAGRRDFSLEPAGDTLLDRLASRGIPRLGVGKVDDLFAGRNIVSTHTPTNEAAYALIESGLETMDAGLLFANVIEFDQSWGHRNDVEGFRRGLLELDAAMPRLLKHLRDEDLVIFTADHGNDPTTASTDHSREAVPLLATGPRVRPVGLGRRPTFADIGQTVAEFLGAGPIAAGTSFLNEVWT
ncbi:MAG TPA: phosphopentomutase [Gemmatimonadales bacterium]|jgi:phosphopentomutase|nr:phosphopentomutase [Gemmatimonadales bacterium]